MSKLLLIVVAVLAFVAQRVNAQPAFTAENYGKIGDKDTAWFAPYTPIENDLNVETGNGYTWDFTKLTFLPNLFGITQFRKPIANSSKPFPDATMEMYTNNGTESIMLLKLSNDTLYDIREGDESSGQIFDPPMPHLVFPIAFGATYVGSQDIWVANHGIRAFNRTVTASYDGFGTLKLNWGTYTNVKRIRLSIIDSSVIPSIPTINRYYSYWWYAEGSGIPLLRLQYTGADAGTTKTYFVYAKKGNGVASSSVEPERSVEAAGGQGVSLANGPEIYPNPAVGLLHLTEPAIVTVTNMVGQVVLRTERTLSVSLEGLPSGTYFCRLDASTPGTAAQSGKSVVRRVVKQ